MKSAGTIPGRTGAVLKLMVFLVGIDAVAVKTGWVICAAAAGADLLLVACRWLWLILVGVVVVVVVVVDAGRLLEKRTFRRCLPVAAMMGIWGCSHRANLCNDGFFVCLVMKSQVNLKKRLNIVHAFLPYSTLYGVVLLRIAYCPRSGGAGVPTVQVFHSLISRFIEVIWRINHNMDLENLDNLDNPR